MTSSQITLLIFICAFISAFFYFDLGHYLTLETLKAQQSVIENYRAANPKLAVAVSPGRDDSLQKAQGNLPIRSAR